MDSRARQLSPARARRALPFRRRMGRLRRRSADPPRLAVPRAGVGPDHRFRRRTGARFRSRAGAAGQCLRSGRRPCRQAQRKAATRSCSRATPRARASASPACSKTTGSSPRSWPTAGRKRSAARPSRRCSSSRSIMASPRPKSRCSPSRTCSATASSAGARSARPPPPSSKSWRHSTPGDLVVHADHGIGRYEGLTQIPVSKVPHDCVALEYARGNKLYVPVENIELLSRYGNESEGVDASTASAARRGSGASRG